MAITHDDDVDDDRARRVRVARVWAGLTRHELAERLGVSFQTVERSETGRRRLELDELVLIGDVCQVPAPFMRYGWPACCADADYLERLYQRLDELGREVQRLGRGRPARGLEALGHAGAPSACTVASTSPSVITAASPPGR